MKALYALYTDPHTVQQAVDALRGLGLPDKDIIVMSSEPFEEYEFSHRDKATWLYAIAAAGGAAGLAAGYLLTSTTQQAWPLVTSGMPIVAMWPNTIVIFEMTMLGAILSTVLALLVTASLPSRLSHLYDTAITRGYILVGVQRPSPEMVDRLTETLGGLPGAEVKKVA